jgi:hypothetical protein
MSFGWSSQTQPIKHGHLVGFLSLYFLTFAIDAAFGHDGLGQIGSETTINSGDLAGILMIAVQALEKRTAELKHKEARIAVLELRLEALELRQNRSMQITAEKGVSMHVGSRPMSVESLVSVESLFRQ